MKRLIIIAAAILAASCTLSFNIGQNKIIGNGNVEEKTFEFESFDAIRVAGSMDVVYIQEDVKPVAVLRTDENLIDEYTLEVVDGVLVIGVKKGSMPMPRTGAKVTVTAPVVNSVNVSGSGDCEIPNGLETGDDFTFSVSGSGDLEAYSIRCREFKSGVSGSGDISIGSLFAESATMTVSGSGDVEVEALTSDSVSIGIFGSGSADIGCRDAGDINVRISGSGSISLAGTARSLSQHISGSGSVHARNLSLSE